MPNVVKYVKFIRGSKAAYDNLAVKDSDTLYFISEPGASSGTLYLGTKLIAGGSITGATKLADLEDVLVSANIPNGSLLVYDSASDMWVNKTVAEIFGSILNVFQGATEDSDGSQGLVPAPQAGEQGYFLKGDGSWDIPVDGRVDTLIGDDEGLSVREILASALIPEDAKASLDTLKEIADWIQKHPDDAAAMNAKITTLEGSVSDLTSGLATVEATVVDLGDRVSTLETHVTEIDERLRWWDLDEE